MPCIHTVPWLSVLYLDFRQHWNDGGRDAEQHVETDEELVDEAPIRFGVEDKEQHNCHWRQDVVQDCDSQQS